MDGNGRWARLKKKARISGHKEGRKRLKEIVRHCAKLNIKALTLFAFSIENWQRPKKEVDLLMELFLSSLKSETAEFDRNNIKLNIIGDKQRFSQNLQKEINKSETVTASNTGLVLNIAANYGGRWEIVQAAKDMYLQAKKANVDPDMVDEAYFSTFLSFKNLPEPDLLIRTGGEYRLSNFLIWHLSYTELYFTDILWPDFTKDKLDKAIFWFGGRERKYGKTDDDIN